MTTRKKSTISKENKESITVPCIVCGKETELKKIVVPYKEIAKNIATMRDDLIYEDIMEGICTKCNGEFMEHRCKYLSKDGSTFCKKKNIRIGVSNPELVYCMCGYRKATETPKMPCHSQFEKPRVIEI